MKITLDAYFDEFDVRFLYRRNRSLPLEEANEEKGVNCKEHLVSSVVSELAEGRKLSHRERDPRRSQYDYLILARIFQRHE